MYDNANDTAFTGTTRAASNNVRELRLVAPRLTRYLRVTRHGNRGFEISDCLRPFTSQVKSRMSRRIVEEKIPHRSGTAITGDSEYRLGVLVKAVFCAGCAIRAPERRR